MMPKDSQVAISLVRAIEHGHIPQEQDSGALLEKALLSNDSALRTTQREELVSIIDKIDYAVEEIDVISIFLEWEAKNCRERSINSLGRLLWLASSIQLAI